MTVGGSAERPINPPSGEFLDSAGACATTESMVDYLGRPHAGRVLFLKHGAIIMFNGDRALPYLEE